MRKCWNKLENQLRESNCQRSINNWDQQRWKNVKLNLPRRASSNAHRSSMQQTWVFRKKNVEDQSQQLQPSLRYWRQNKLNEERQCSRSISAQMIPAMKRSANLTTEELFWITDSATNNEHSALIHVIHLQDSWTTNPTSQSFKRFDVHDEEGWYDVASWLGQRSQQVQLKVPQRSACCVQRTQKLIVRTTTRGNWRKMIVQRWNHIKLPKQYWRSFPISTGQSHHWPKEFHRKVVELAESTIVSARKAATACNQHKHISQATSTTSCCSSRLLDLSNCQTLQLRCHATKVTSKHTRRRIRRQRLARIWSENHWTRMIFFIPREDEDEEHSTEKKSYYSVFFRDSRIFCTRSLFLWHHVVLCEVSTCLSHLVVNLFGQCQFLQRPAPYISSSSCYEYLNFICEWMEQCNWPLKGKSSLLVTRVEPGCVVLGAWSIGVYTAYDVVVEDDV